MDKKFFVNNRKKIMDTIEDNSILVLFSGDAPQRSADQNYNFTVNRNFYYLTGLEKEKFILLITKKQEKVNEALFIEEPNPKLEKWIGRRMRKEEVKELSDIENIQYIKDFHNYFSNLFIKQSFDNIFLDLEKRGWDSPNTPALDFAKSVREKYPYLRINNVYTIISEFRKIKSSEEIDKIKKAINITQKGIENLMINSNPGMKEYQLEAFFDFTIKSLGAEEHAFKTIAASGENATVLHYEENSCDIEDNTLILFDLGAQYEKYSSDISRTFPINGKFTERQKQIYDIVLKAEIETMKAIKPGIAFKELNNITKKILAEECKKIGLIEDEKDISKYYYHGVSHFLGLDTHDVGDYNDELKPGMILTVEPGLYIEEEKIGVRIEDDVLVTEDGYENLSKDIIKTTSEIEEFMKNNKK